MLTTKIKTALSAVVLVGALTTGATTLTYCVAAGQDGKQPPAAKEDKPVDPHVGDQQPNDKAAFTAWGKLVDGLQAGLGFRDAGRAYHPGETVVLVVRVRNFGKEKAKYSYRPDLFYENPPSVTGGDGKPVVVEGSPIILKGLPRTVDIEVPPGDMFELCEMKLVIRPAAEARDPQPAWTLFGTGKYQLRYDRAPAADEPREVGGIQPVNLLGNLDTGKLDLVVEDRVAFTAWGKEVDGYQMGLGFRPGERRVYHPGETVKLVVRFRNVGKTEATVPYSKEVFYRNPPSVTAGGGRRAVPIENSIPLGEPKQLDLKVAPGAVVDLCELDLQLRPETEREKVSWVLFGTGKFQLRYDRAGNSILDTGALDLEVQERVAYTTWGEPAGGLQAGLGYPRGGRRAYYLGETAKLVLRVRNVGTVESDFTYSKEHYYQNPPAVTSDKGVAVPLMGSNAWLKPRLEEVKLKAGEEIDLCVFDVKLRSPRVEADDTPWALHGVGKFRVRYQKGIELPSGLSLPGSGLATGELELEVQEADGNNIIAVGERGPVVKRFSLNRAEDVADIAKVLAPLFKDAKITADPRTKSLVVEAGPKTFDLLAPLVERLDRPADPAPMAPSDPEATFLKRPEEAKLNFASSPRFDPRVFVYRAEPISGKVADHSADAQEVVLDVGLKDGVRFGHAFQIGTAKSGEWVAVAKVMELEGNRCVAKVVSLSPSHASKSLKGLAAVGTAPKPDKDKVAVETRVGKNVWHTESLENKIIRGLLDTAGPDARILIVQESGVVERKE